MADLQGAPFCNPAERLSETEGWDAYVERVRARSGVLRNKKVKLLRSENAAELAEKYTALAETAWIAKLSRAILDAFFGWKTASAPMERSGLLW